MGCCVRLGLAELLSACPWSVCFWTGHGPWEAELLDVLLRVLSSSGTGAYLRAQPHRCRVYSPVYLLSEALGEIPH